MEAAVKPNVRIRQQQTLSIFTKFPAQIESKRRQVSGEVQSDELLDYITPLLVYLPNAPGERNN